MRAFMRVRLLLLLPFALMLGAPQDGASKKPRANATDQVRRGRALFLESPKGKPCGTCHTMDGIGASVGPDLTKMATYAMPRGIVVAMHMSLAETVQMVKPVKGSSFAGLLRQKEAENIEIWDLSQMPPVLRTFQAVDIQSLKRDEKWKHPPSVTSYDGRELADLVAFLKWAATGSVKPVTAEEVETSH
jgi:mono/diheme cytochrome c family protein